MIMHTITVIAIFLSFYIFFSVFVVIVALVDEKKRRKSSNKKQTFRKFVFSLFFVERKFSNIRSDHFHRTYKNILNNIAYIYNIHVVLT